MTTSPLDNLEAAGQLHREPPVLALSHQPRNDAEYEGFVDVDQRLIEDLITACEAVDAALVALPPL